MLIQEIFLKNKGKIMKTMKKLMLVGLLAMPAVQETQAFGFDAISVSATGAKNKIVSAAKSIGRAAWNHKNIIFGTSILVLCLIFHNRTRANNTLSEETLKNIEMLRDNYLSKKEVLLSRAEQHPGNYDIVNGLKLAAENAIMKELSRR